MNHLELGAHAFGHMRRLHTHKLYMRKRAAANRTLIRKLETFQDPYQSVKDWREELDHITVTDEEAMADLAKFLTGKR